MLQDIAPSKTKCFSQRGQNRSARHSTTRYVRTDSTRMLYGNSSSLILAVGGLFNPSIVSTINNTKYEFMMIWSKVRLPVTDLRRALCKYRMTDVDLRPPYMNRTTLLHQRTPKKTPSTTKNAFPMLESTPSRFKNPLPIRASITPPLRQATGLLCLGAPRLHIGMPFLN